MKRTYVRVTLALESAWRVGSWDARAANAVEMLIDQLTGGPMVPGTGVAGGLRAAAQENGQGPELFGPEPGDAQAISPWWILGTVVEGAQMRTRRRTKIDRERGAAVPKGLFEMDEAHSGTVRIYFRSEADDPCPFLDLLAGWRPRVGGGRTTGLGRAHVTEITSQTLDLTTRDGVLALLGGGGPVERVEALLGRATPTEARPEQQPVLVTAKVTCPYLAQPEDVQTLTNGSALKGILRSRVEFIARSLGLPCCSKTSEWTGCGTCPVCDAFGSTSRGGVWEFLDAPWTVHQPDQQVVRVAIDRFTGGTRDGALFPQYYAPGVEMELTIMGPRLESEHAWVERSLLHALRDLDDGLVTIGPEGASGYGRVSLSEVEFAGSPVAFDKLPTVRERELAP